MMTTTDMLQALDQDGWRVCNLGQFPTSPWDIKLSADYNHPAITHPYGGGMVSRRGGFLDCKSPGDIRMVVAEAHRTIYGQNDDDAVAEALGEPLYHPPPCPIEEAVKALRHKGWALWNVSGPLTTSRDDLDRLWRVRVYPMPTGMYINANLSGPSLLTTLQKFVDAVPDVHNEKEITQDVQDAVDIGIACA